MVDEKWGMARHAAFRRRTTPDALRASCALELADCWCRSSAFQVLSMACERARDRAPARCLISARRRAVLRLLRPPAFPGRMTERTSGDCQSREVCVAPGASLALRLKAPPSERPGALCLRAQGEPLDRRSAAAATAGSGEPARARRRLPVQLDLAAHSCPSKSAAASTN